MKLFGRSLVLMGICCSGNSYAMENNNQDLNKKLSEANQLVGKAENVLLDMQSTLMVALFTREGCVAFVAKKESEAIDFADQAKSLAQSVLDDKQVTPETKKSAELSLRKISLLTQKTSQYKTNKPGDTKSY